MYKNFPPVPKDRFTYEHNPVAYPNELLSMEVTAHYGTTQEYKDELTLNAIDQINSTKPDVELISKQPQLTAEYRVPILDFLARCAKRTKVAPSIFYKSARLFDRYCSKRIVLMEQAKLVAATCLWLAAKTEGGFNHAFSSSSCPTGGRYVGPTVRARIPRLTELCILCEPVSGYDEGMFVQMERHVLDTLGWNVTEPTIHEWAMTIGENATLTGFMSEQDTNVVLLKHFLCDCTLYSQELIAIHPAELAASIHDILNKICGMYYDRSEYGCNLPQLNRNTTFKLLETISSISPGLLQMFGNPTIMEFVKRCRWYLQSIHTRQLNVTPPSPASFEDSSIHQSDESDVDSIFDQCMSSISSFSPMVTPDKQQQQQQMQPLKAWGI